MKPSSKLFLSMFSRGSGENCGTTDVFRTDEYILQTTVRTEGDASASTDTAPEPLLANYGFGRIRRSYLDVNLLASLNAAERTLQDYIDMG